MNGLPSNPCIVIKFSGLDAPGPHNKEQEKQIPLLFQGIGYYCLRQQAERMQKL